MFRNWRWQPFPLKKGNCSVGRRDRTANEFTVAPEKMQVCARARRTHGGGREADGSGCVTSVMVGSSLSAHDVVFLMS